MPTIRRAKAEIRGLRIDHGRSVSSGAYTQFNDFRVASARVAGTIMDLPEGSTGPVVAGRGSPGACPGRHGQRLQPVFWDGVPSGVTQTFRSYYAEARLPLVPRDNRPALLSGLELQVAARHEAMRAAIPANRDDLLLVNDDPVDDRQAAPVYTLGLRVFPVTNVMLSASFATGVVPPAIAQLACATIRYAASEDRGGIAAQHQFSVNATDAKRRGAAPGPAANNRWSSPSADHRRPNGRAAPRSAW